MFPRSPSARPRLAALRRAAADASIGRALMTAPRPCCSTTVVGSRSPPPSAQAGARIVARHRRAVEQNVAMALGSPTAPTCCRSDGWSSPGRPPGCGRIQHPGSLSRRMRTGRQAARSTDTFVLEPPRVFSWTRRTLPGRERAGAGQRPRCSASTSPAPGQARVAAPLKKGPARDRIHARRQLTGSVEAPPHSRRAPVHRRGRRVGDGYCESGADAALNPGPAEVVASSESGSPTRVIASDDAQNQRGSDRR
jgi:hypothetical protein